MVLPHYINCYILSILEQVLLQKTYEITTLYQNELNRLKEDQLRKWNEIINQLGMLQNQDNDIVPQAKKFIEELQRLQKQSEDNRRILMENTELQNLMKTQSVISEDKSLMQDLDQIMKNATSNTFGMLGGTFATNTMITGLNLQTPIDHLKNHNVDDSSIKKPDNPIFHSPEDYNRNQKRNLLHVFAKKPNLQIDVDLANEEQNESKYITKSHEKLNKTAGSAQNVSSSILNLDIHNLRYVLPSEALLREESGRTLNPQASTPSMKGRRHPELENSEHESLDFNREDDLGVSIFEREPFKEFTHKKFKELLQHDNMQNLIKMREDALDARHQTQAESLEKMLENKRFSPKTFHHKKVELEKWVTKEKEHIKKSKKEIERGWLQTADAIKRVCFIRLD